MDSFMSRTSFLLFIVSFSSLLLANAIPSTRPLHVVHRSDIKPKFLKFCEKTTNPSLCAQTIQPHFHDHQGDVDPLKALEIEVDATHNQTKKTVGVIDELLAKQDTPNSLKDSLKTCKDQYNNILDSIKETKDAIANKDVANAKYKFSAVLSFQSTCKDEFEGGKFPFANDSDAVFQLGGNCLDIFADIVKAAPQQAAPAAQSPPSPFSNIIGTLS